MTAERRFATAARLGAAIALAAFALGAAAHDKGHHDDDDGPAAAGPDAQIEIINIDNPGVGFNDPEAATPVGGNAGVTLGEQRQILFAFAADTWAKKLHSAVPIRVLATFDALDCDANSGVLGAASAWNAFFDFPSAPHTGTWYPSALANKLAGAPLIDDPDPMVSADIVAFFNGNLGRPGCLEGSAFYMGLDGKAPTGQIDLLTTVLHEFGHGLGFATFTSGSTGSQLPVSDAPDAQTLPTVYDHFLLDVQQARSWAELTPEQRVVSAVTPFNLVWNGTHVRRDVPRVLERGVPELSVAGPGGTRAYRVGTASFGAAIDGSFIAAGTLVPVVDQANGTGLACSPLDAANAAAVRRHVAIIDRGQCAFTQKVKNAQDAGARAVIIADNAPGSPAVNLSGTDDSITIAAVRVTQADGAELKQLAAGSKHHLRPLALLFSNPAQTNGADRSGRPYLFTPDPFQRGSSVSHYDPTAKRDLLMEPFATDDLAIAVSAPQDLTLELLEDIGW